MIRNLRPHLILVSMLLGGMAASPLWQVTS
jgi:hypothetical protein